MPVVSASTMVLVVALAVGPSWIDGRGLLVAQEVQKDQPLFPAISLNCTLEHPYGAFVNHCELKPTAYIGKDLWIRAASDLEPNTELTVDYNRPIDFITTRGTTCRLVPPETGFVKC